MADIEVDYEAIPTKTSAMREDAKKLNTELSSVYASISEMHNSWHGKRYNALVEDFNKMIDSLNSMLDLVVEQIPDSLDAIANNYSQADSGTKIATGARATTKKITALALSNDVGMKFVEGDVTSIQQSVSRNFSSAVELINAFESKFNQLSWSGAAAESFRTKFNKLKGEIVTAFENINSQFSKAMEQTKEDINATENSNNVQ